MLLEVFHETRYDYAAPVSLAQHLAHLRPLDDEHQWLREFHLDISPAPGHRHEAQDPLGNTSIWFSLRLPHRSLVVTACSVVELAPRFEGLQPEASPAWDRVAERLRYVARAPFDPAVEFALPSPHVPRLPELAAYAAESLSPARPVAEAAIELMHRLHADFQYDGSSTEIDTPLAEAFAQKRGVCQDFAHLMAGALRMHGVPVRYVSGYLLTQPGDDTMMVGADASHAWVQVYCPGTPGVPADGWLDLDPTNDVIPATGHVRVAVGRDFSDVTPLRGVIRGGGRHTLSVGVHTRVLGPVDLASRQAENGPLVAKEIPDEEKRST
jgi:transglutaminase-like putative cysteine protease